MNDAVPLERPTELPATWAKAPLDSLGDWFGGGTPSKDKPAYWSGGSVPWVSPKDVKVARIVDTEDHITEQAVRNSATSLVPAGAVLMVTRSGILRHTFPVAVAGIDVTLNQDMKALAPFDGIGGNYIAAALRAFEGVVLSQCAKDGTTVQSIEFSRLKDFQVPIAPLNEQHRIVAKIDELFSELDAGVASLKRARALLKRYRQAVLKAAVTGELTRDWRERHQRGIRESGADLLQRILKARRQAWEAAELKKLRAKGKPPKDDRWKQNYKEPQSPDITDQTALPEGWVWVSIGQIFNVFIGSTPSRSEPAYWGGDVPWVSSGEVAFCRIKRTRETITQRGLRNSSTRLHPPGTVLLGIIGEGKTRGQAAILDIEACNNQNAAAIRVSDTDIPPEYVYYFLLWRYEETRRGSSGGNQPALNRDRVRQFILPLPSLGELAQLISELDTHTSQIEYLQTSIDKQLRAVSALRQSILKTAFAGRLVPQDPNDEPASALLERIRAERAAAPKPARGRRRKAAPGARQLELLE